MSFALNIRQLKMATPLLFCCLGADGLAAQQVANSSVEIVRTYLRSYLGPPTTEADKETRFLVAQIDLNGDRRPEVLVYLAGQDWCGSGGCTLLILTPFRQTYRVVTKASITQLPVRVLPTRNAGWSDIGVWVEGGGIRTGYEAKLRFDGKRYPSNPSVPPAIKTTNRPAGTVIFSREALSRATPVFP